MAAKAASGRESRGIGERTIAVISWAILGGGVLLLVLRDLSCNPVLDERHYVQGGLAAAANLFVRTGFSSGPAYLLVGGALDMAVYAAGAAIGSFESPADFMGWHLVRPAPLFLLARLLTAVVAVGGLGLLARAMALRIGIGWASLLCVGFAFTMPSLHRMSLATPHGILVGLAAGLLACLIAAARDDSAKAWVGAGLLVSSATCTMTIGAGLALLPVWAAAALPCGPEGLSKKARFARLGGGALTGLVVFGFPILLHPLEFWELNIRYQYERQLISETASGGGLLVEWAIQAPTLWIAALIGVRGFKDPKDKAVAVGALLTAMGYLGFLAAFTSSKEVSYSLAALPCLAFAASGLVPWAETLRRRALILVCVAVFSLPSGHAFVYLAARAARPDPKVEAVRTMTRLLPEGAVVLVDSWWGPRLPHRALILEPYAKHVPLWSRDPAFRRRLDEGMEADPKNWDVIVYPAEADGFSLEFLQRRRITHVVVSDVMMSRGAHAPIWSRLRRDGSLEDLSPGGSGPIRYFRVRS